jgi:hypothetical protein
MAASGVVMLPRRRSRQARPDSPAFNRRRLVSVEGSPYLRRAQHPCAEQHGDDCASATRYQMNTVMLCLATNRSNQAIEA